jgi:hypothetical protein
MKLTIPAAKVETALLQVEDLLMDATGDPWLLSDDQQGALRAFEAVATTAVEDRHDVVIDSIVADLISDAFRGSHVPVNPGCERLCIGPNPCSETCDI